MKVIYYSILIVAAMASKGVIAEEETEFNRCVYKETCSSEDAMVNYEVCFEQIPEEDQGPTLKTVEDNYGLEGKPIDEFVQSVCGDLESGKEILGALYTQIRIAYQNNNLTANEDNERKYLVAEDCIDGIYKTCHYKEINGFY